MVWAGPTVRSPLAEVKTARLLGGGWLPSEDYNCFLGFLRVILGTLVVNNNFCPFYWQVHVLWEIIGRNMRNVSRDVEVPSKGTEIIYLIWQFYFWMYKGNWQVPSLCPFLRNVFPNAAERLHRWHLSPWTLTNAQREMPWPVKGNWGPVIPRVGDACRCFLG